MIVIPAITSRPVVHLESNRPAGHSAQQNLNGVGCDLRLDRHQRRYPFYELNEDGFQYLTLARRKQRADP